MNSLSFYICSSASLGFIFQSRYIVLSFPRRASSLMALYSVVVTIRTLVGCKYRHALRAKHLGSRGFFFLWRLVWTASALDHLPICCLAPNTEDVIISSAYQRCRVHIVRYCVAAELEDFDRDSRTDGLIYMAYMAVNLIHFRPLFLEFLRQSKTSL